MNTTDTSIESQPFQAEVSELLHLMVHSVYSETDIFLRELISNASDACDKLRYEAIAKPDLIASDAALASEASGQRGDPMVRAPDTRPEPGSSARGALAIRIKPDTAAGTLTIADTGIGMDRAELIDNLGTLARSGTRAFMARLA